MQRLIHAWYFFDLQEQINALLAVGWYIPPNCNWIGRVNVTATDSSYHWAVLEKYTDNGVGGR